VYSQLSYFFEPGKLLRFFCGGAKMGSGSYSKRAWDDFRTSRHYDDPGTTTADIYASRGLDDSLNPKKFGIRESVDGADNPEATPIMIALDVTGSMGPVLDRIAREGLKTVCEEVYNRKPVTDPHICVLGVGDVEFDSAPLQATQFEADIRIFEQLEKLFLEGGGGGNSYESYILAWYFAKFRTKTDSFSKRGRKGFIFTIGDEESTPNISGAAIKAFLGDEQARDYTASDLIDLVYPEWNVYHIIIKQGSHASRAFDSVKASWDKVLGAQKVIPLDDFTFLGETIVSALEVAAGKSVRDVTASWDGSKSIAIGNAIAHMEAVKSEMIDAVL
jgi:hypothetical protein